MQEGINIKVIVGSVREGRFADKAARWAAEELKKQKGANVEILDLKEYEMPFFDSAVSPSTKQEPYANEVVEKFTAKIDEADAFLVIAPEYNHGPTAVLKNAMDWVGKEWNRKPIAFVGYGSVGGARAIEQLRLVAVEQQMAPINGAVHILGNEYFPVAMGQGTSEELFAADSQQGQMDYTASELMWWAEALKKARVGGGSN